MRAESASSPFEVEKIRMRASPRGQPSQQTGRGVRRQLLAIAKSRGNQAALLHHAALLRLEELRFVDFEVQDAGDRQKDEEQVKGEQPRTETQRSQPLQPGTQRRQAHGSR